MGHLRLGGLVLAAIAALAACGPLTRDPVEAPAPCTATVSEPLKELVIVDEAVLTNAVAMNANDGALSFRHVTEQVARLPVEWLDGGVDLARAPFRLIAIVNRIDLAESGAGEGRLVFAATKGPGDDPAAPGLPLTVIFEFRLDGDAGEWAARWRALGAEPAFDANYMQTLSALTGRFVGAEHLAQVRVHDARGTDRMLELQLDAKGTLQQAGLRRTPSHALDGSEALRDFVLAHRDDILADRHEVPREMLAAQVELGDAWRVPGADEPLRHAFATGTCDGCHGNEQPTTDGTFHISPRARGVAKLSRFLFDPDHRADDELSRRAAVLERLACGR